MTSPTRSVVVRLALDPSSFVAGAARAEQSTLALDAATAKVGPNAATSMEKAAAGAGKAEGALGSLNKSAGVLGVTLGGLAGAGVAVAAGLSIKWAADYQSALVRLETTAGESQKNIAAVGQGMLDMAGQVGISAQELAQGMYVIDSAGIHGADSLVVLKAAAQGARQENAELSHVVDAVTTSLHDYHLPASDAAKVTSQLIAAVSNGKTTFDDLTGAMHSVEPKAAAAGMSISQTAGALAAMTASGMHAQQAAENLASSISSFSRITAPMRDELSALGLDAQDLQDHLGERGIAGTLQIVSDAIVRQLGPSGKVALNAINQNKTAAADLLMMIQAMPKDLGKLSQGLLDGSVSILDYQKAAKGLGSTQGAMALQFLSLVKSSDGFNGILKAGGPAVQTYLTALGKAVGTSEGLSVALQLTGENAAGANKAIDAVAKAAGDGKGNIEGWGKVQATFNQQLAQTEQGARSLATEAGQHLLPVLTSTFGYVNHDVLPGLEHLGSATSSAVHWFSQLPAPIKDTAYALGAIKLAEQIGLWGRLTAVPGQFAGAIRTASASMGGFSDEIAVQQRLMAMEASSAATASTATSTLAERMAALTAAGNGTTESLTRAQMTLRGWDAALAGTAAAEDVATASTGRLTAAMATAQIRGAGALTSGLKGLLGVVGGPWGAAFIGATLGVTALESAMAKHDEQVKQATQDVLNWNKAIDLGVGGKSSVDAQQHLADLKNQIADLQQQIEAYGSSTGMNFRVAGASAANLKDKQAELKKELIEGTQAWKDQLAGMTPVEIAQARVDAATRDLNMALKDNPPNSQAVTNASIRLHDAQKGLADETDRANDAAKTQIQRLQDQANAALGLLGAQRSAQLAQMQLNDAIDQYNSDAKDGQHTTRQLQEEQLGLVNTAQQTAQAAADAAAAQAKQNGATDTAAASQAAFVKSLQETAAHLDGDAKQAVLNMIVALNGQQSQAMLTAGAINQIGVKVLGLPDSHTIEIDVPTDDQMKKLHDLGYVTVTLPNGHVLVTADTTPAQTAIQALLTKAYVAWVDVRASNPTPNFGPTQRPGAAIGGIVEPFAAGGWYTPMSGRIADIVAPQTYRLIGDRVTGDEAFIPINGSARSQQILAETAARMGFGLSSKERAAPVRTRELVGTGVGGAGNTEISRTLQELRATVARLNDGRALVNIQTWNQADQSTPYETAEALAFISRTRSN